MQTVEDFKNYIYSCEKEYNAVTDCGLVILNNEKMVRTHWFSSY